MVSFERVRENFPLVYQTTTNISAAELSSRVTSVLQRSGKTEERLNKRLEKRLEKRGNTWVENLTKGTN